MNRIILSASLCILFFACKSQKQHDSLQIISEKIGDNALIDYNLDRTFALIQEKFALVQQGDYTSKYLIIKLEDNQVIREGKVVNGYIKWINDDVIELFEMPGIIRAGQDEDDFKKRINVREISNDKQIK